MLTWKNADELIPLAAPIIEEHHPDLVDAPIRFVWRSEAKKLHGGQRVALGTAEVVTGRFAQFVMTEEELAKADGLPLAEPAMFWIEIAADYWAWLTPEQRLALLDHELSHCMVEEARLGFKLVMRPHDVEEFNDIVRRHGLWTDDLQQFAAALLGLEGS